MPVPRYGGLSSMTSSRLSLDVCLVLCMCHCMGEDQIYSVVGCKRKSVISSSFCCRYAQVCYPRVVVRSCNHYELGYPLASARDYSFCGHGIFKCQGSFLTRLSTRSCFNAALCYALAFANRSPAHSTCNEWYASYKP